MAEIRESIIDVIDVIPLTLSKAKQYLNIFADSSELHECSANLYVAILDTLDAIVRHYQKHVARKYASVCRYRRRLTLCSRSGKLRNIQAEHEWRRASGQNKAH